MLIKTCEGCTCLNVMNCSLYEMHERVATLYSLKAIEECPCISCIVKTMCKQVCEDWENNLKAFSPDTKFVFAQERKTAYV